MKNLLLFTALLAIGFAVGKKRARKKGPVDVVSIEIECNAKGALADLKELERQATKTAMRLESVNHAIVLHASGKDLVGVLNVATSRQGRVVGGKL
ncbi:MAG: hypothetical protein ACRYG7_14205 [Janthinobacterium lividum]